MFSLLINCIQIKSFLNSQLCSTYIEIFSTGLELLYFLINILFELVCNLYHFLNIFISFVICFFTIRDPIDLHILICLTVLLNYLVLETCIICFVLCIQRYYVKYIVPQEMLIFYMILEFYFLFFQILSRNIAYVASICLIFIQVIIILSQLRESIDHDT